MADLNKSSHDGAECGSAIGVIKFSYKKSGYPDILKIAQDWSKDPNFYQVIVRRVSQDDFGIQFIFFSKELNDPKVKGDFKDKYIDPIKDLLYAYDIAYASGSVEKALDGIIKNIPIEEASK
ncbi:hypothetical protein HYV12_04220 [Candidatus Dojkabacteria bacterium]|nr:hypothetical protein [Candidatus Dojkabacteria bacterium]